jgi:hypothetical protein
VRLRRFTLRISQFVPKSRTIRNPDEMATPNSLPPIPRNCRIHPAQSHKERYPHLDRPHHASLLYTTNLPNLSSNMSSPPLPSNRQKTFKQFMAKVEEQKHQQLQQRWQVEPFQTPHSYESPFDSTGQLPPSLEQLRGNAGGEVQQLFGNEFLLSNSEAGPFAEPSPSQNMGLVSPSPMKQLPSPLLGVHRIRSLSGDSSMLGSPSPSGVAPVTLRHRSGSAGSSSSPFSSVQNTPSPSPFKTATQPTLSPIRTSELRVPTSMLEPKSPSNPGAFLRYQQQRQLETALHRLPVEAWNDTLSAHLPLAPETEMQNIASPLDGVTGNQNASNPSADPKGRQKVYNSLADGKGKQKVSNIPSAGPVRTRRSR